MPRMTNPASPESSPRTFKTIGVIGLGNVGSEVAKRAHGLEMDVIAYDPVVSVERAELFNVALVGLNDLLERADFVTVHVPLVDSNRDLIGAGQLALMKPDAYLINTARGAVVDVSAVLEALRAGTSGFLLKVSPPEQLIGAIRTVAAGNALIDPAVTRRVIEAFGRRATTSPPPPSYEELTAREREVLVLLARGRSNAEIAGALIVGEATVKTHVARVLMKLGLRDRVQAVVFAYEHGIVTPGEDADR